jgi:hypothetical protein
MKRLTAVLIPLLLIVLSTGVRAQETETQTYTIVKDGKVQQIEATTTKKVLQEINLGKEVSENDLKNLSKKGLLDQLIAEGVTADTSDYPIAVSIFPKVTYEKRYSSKVFVVDDGAIERAPEKDEGWTSPGSGWLSSLVFLVLPFFLILLSAKKSIREERTKEFTIFSFVSLVGLSLIALSTLPGYGHITNFVESNASTIFMLLAAGLVVITLAVIFIRLIERSSKRSSIEAVMCYALFIITLPKNLYIQALILYAGFCLLAYLIIKGVDFLVEKKAEKKWLAAENP